MFITKELAAKIESCIKQTHQAVTQEYAQGQILEINGGAAFFSGSESFLSQVVNWGFASKAKHFAKELAQIEHFYKSCNHTHVNIELCPYVGNDLISFLSGHGYKVTEVSNVSVMDLSNLNTMNHPKQEHVIRLMEKHEIEEWAKRVAVGFGFAAAQKQFQYYAQAQGVLAFGAFINDHLVAGATLSLQNDICDLGVTSTLHDFRGRGLQKALLSARLHYAKDKGLSLATVTTEPGSISDLNIQKVGFHCAYTRLKLTK